MAVPHSLEVEKSLLGTILMDNSVWMEVDGKLEASDFYKASHGALFSLIQQMLRNGEHVDPLVVNDRITGSTEYGDPMYVVGLMDEATSSYAVPAYVKQLKELGIRRRVLEQCDKLREMASDRGVDVELLLSEGEQGLQALAGGMATEGWVSMRELMERQWKEALRKSDARKEGKRHGWSTGYSQWDRIIGGLIAGNLYIIAARPGVGKTAYALNIMMNMAKQGHGSAFFSLEMPDGQLGDRLLANVAGIDSYHLRDGLDGKTEDGREAMRRLSAAVDDIHQYPIWVDDRPSRIEQIRSRARRLKAKHPTLRLIVIDYLQIVSMDTKDKRSREVFVNNVAMQSKEMAKELGVAVIDLAQLNRSCEYRPIADKGRMPQMSDLRESGGIEQAADAIVFIYMDSMYNDACPEPDIADFRVSKNRHGQSPAMFPLRFEKKYQRFVEVDRRWE